MDNTSQTVATWVAAAAAVIAVGVAWWAAYCAKKIGEKQNEINEGIKALQAKQTDAEHFVELSVQAIPVNSLPEAAATGYFQPQNMDVIVKSVGTYTVYLNRYWFQKGTPQLLDYAAVPSDGYRIPISKDDFGGDGVLVLTIEFEDYRQNRYQSEHVIVFPKRGARLEIRSKKKEKIKL